MGTSQTLPDPEQIKMDHPHAYGDKALYSDTDSIKVGSSPRVWGQVIDELGELEIEGIIPTRMGTSM